MMLIINLIFIFLAKFLTGLLRIFNLGSGTALPGLLVEKYYPRLISVLARNFNTIILISGTNGKTTTQKSLVKIFTDQGYTVVSNRSGANLLRAIAAVLMQRANLLGKIAEKNAIFEVEEATLPKLVKYLNPSCFIFTNLFRDQLDAYGELDKTRYYLQQACQQKPGVPVIINQDDPKLLELSREISNPQEFFSIGSYAADFKYEGNAVSKISRKPLILVRKIKIMENLSSLTNLEVNGKKYLLKYLPPGIFNVYNALAALTAVVKLEMHLGKALDALASFKIPFGRGEVINISLHKISWTLRLFLIKNPAGFNQVLQLLTNLRQIKAIIALNDKIADGRDVSWIWDSNLELLQNHLQQAVVTGTRAWDMALRLKYAGIDLSLLQVNENYQQVINELLLKNKSTRGNEIYILATYTAMNEIRKYFSRFSAIVKIWQ